MSKLKWDQLGEKLAETGVDQGVLYVYDVATMQYGEGVAWNGLTSVNEAPTGGEANPFYADNKKYIEIMSEEDYACSVGCYTYPDEYAACIGEKELAAGITVAQQERVMFGFSYRTKVVNDTQGADYGFKIHIVYNCKAGVTSRDHTTINESPELEELNFDITTTKVDVTGGKPTSHLIIDSTKLPAGSEAKLQTLLDTLYGKDATTEPVAPAVAPKLLMPDEIAAIFAA